MFCVWCACGAGCDFCVFVCNVCRAACGVVFSVVCECSVCRLQLLVQSMLLCILNLLSSVLPVLVVRGCEISVCAILCHVQ